MAAAGLWELSPWRVVYADAGYIELWRTNYLCNRRKTKRSIKENRAGGLAILELRWIMPNLTKHRKSTRIKSKKHLCSGCDWRLSTRCQWNIHQVIRPRKQIRSSASSGVRIFVAVLASTSIIAHKDRDDEGSEQNLVAIEVRNSRKAWHQNQRSGLKHSMRLAFRLLGLWCGRWSLQ